MERGGARGWRNPQGHEGELVYALVHLKTYFHVRQVRQPGKQCGVRGKPLEGRPCLTKPPFRNAPRHATVAHTFVCAGAGLGAYL